MTPPPLTARAPWGNAMQDYEFRKPRIFAFRVTLAGMATEVGGRYMTGATAILRTNGQITLPKAIREALGVNQGDELEFEITGTGEVTVHG